MLEYLHENADIITFIHDTSLHLKLSVLPRTTACILYHRVQRKLKEKKEECFEKYLVASSCLYLASKLDEEPLKIRDIVNVCYRLLHSEKPPLEIGKVYWNLRDSITTCELMLLRLFRFKVVFESPHKYLLHYLKLMEDWVPSITEWRNSNFEQICWNLLNDATYLPLISSWKPDTLATVVIYIVLKTTMLEIPDEKEGRKMFQMFSPSTKEENLEKLSCEVLELYNHKDIIRGITK